MSHAEKITVVKDGQEVFTASAGRRGAIDSADRDFCCFASPIIGAAYVISEDAAKRIARWGYSTTIVRAGIEINVLSTY